MTAITGRVCRSGSVTVEFFRRANVVALIGAEHGALRCDTCGIFEPIRTRLLNEFIARFIRFAAAHQHDEPATEQRAH